ncbi:hypothetical protein GCM10010520_64070 [Rhizobium viscosum]
MDHPPDCFDVGKLAEGSSKESLKEGLEKSFSCFFGYADERFRKLLGRFMPMDGKMTLSGFSVPPHISTLA